MDVEIHRFLSCRLQDLLVVLDQLLAAVVHGVRVGVSGRIVAQLLVRRHLRCLAPTTTTHQLIAIAPSLSQLHISKLFEKFLKP